MISDNLSIVEILKRPNMPRNKHLIDIMNDAKNKVSVVLYFPSVSYAWFLVLYLIILIFLMCCFRSPLC